MASASIVSTNVDVTYSETNITSIKLTSIDAIDKERNVVIIYHSGTSHSIRFDTEAEAATLFDSIKAAISV